MSSSAEKQDRSARLGELLAEFHTLREADPRIGLGVMREKAGDLYAELQDLSDAEELLRIATQEEEPPPERFGPYRILRVIGAGAAGVVYEAEHTETDQRVALKVMRESLSGEIGVVQRFSQESRTADRLDHPNIVHVHDAGELEGRMYIAMELLEGCSLSAVLAKIRSRGGPQPGTGWLEVLEEEGIRAREAEPEDPARAYAARMAALCAPVADALAALSEAELVHRDIKPQNLVLDAEGNLKITDFGLAKVFGNDLTSSVAVLGTPAYMSPEQAYGKSREVDARTDIYGLGATLHEALTLRPPVEADTHGEAIAAVLNERPPDVSALCPAYPSELTVLVRRCLEKDPVDRYQDPSLLAEDLNRLAGGLRPAMKAVSPLRRVRRFAARYPRAAMFSGGVAIAALLLVAFLFTRSAEITIRSHPPGELALDGTSKGRVPWKGDVSPGEHELRITLEKFEPYERCLDLDAGQKWSDTVVLKPLKEDDTEALDAILASMGKGAKFPKGEPARGRGISPMLPTGHWTERVHLIGSRGVVSRSAVELRAYLTGRVEDLSIVLKDRRGSEPKHYEVVVTLAKGEASIPLPQEVAARLVEGAEYRWQLTKQGTPSGRMRSDFKLTEKPDLAVRLAALDAGEEPQPHVLLLAAAELLNDGQTFEAYAAVRALTTGDKKNRAAIRLSLEALQKLNQLGNPLYRQLYAAYQEAGN